MKLNSFERRRHILRRQYSKAYNWCTINNRGRVFKSLLCDGQESTVLAKSVIFTTTISL